MAGNLDPVNFEVFFKRLMTILEEGRKAIAMTSGSPAIVEGGEFMTSFYGGEGKGVLTAAGTLFHVMGSSDAIMHAIEEYTENPGINDGDQFFYNDPYIAGTHLLDQIMIKPIFNRGQRVAWVGTMTHTGDSGGLLRGISTEIFHEGWKFKGIKIVEGNEVRKDIFECIINQSRDPQYVALDLLARVAANNVCEKGFMRLVEKFGIDFIQSAFKKIRVDARNLVREKIKNLPDGTWKERVYACRTVEEGQKEKPLPLKIEVALTIEGDRLSFDCTASPQTGDYFNATLACSRSCLWTSLAGALFYDVPWSSEMMNWVDYTVEEGSFINCRYPASCGLGTNAGQTLIAAAAGCVAKLLYAAGEHEYVNASWGGGSGAIACFGPGTWYGGHNQHGAVVGQGTYDNFAAGQGATPFRDGNDTAGLYVNPRSAISDVEWVEMYFPFLTLAKRNYVGSGGFGKFRGGMGLEVIQLVYGSTDLSVDYLPGPEGGLTKGFGLFGGYPQGETLGDSVLIMTPGKETLQKFKSEKKYPTSFDELKSVGVNVRKSPESNLKRQLGGIRLEVPEYSIFCYSYGCGGGYGDPLDRDPDKVFDDIGKEATTPEMAAKVYGVVIDAESSDIDHDKTQKLRGTLLLERIKKAQPVTPGIEANKIDASKRGKRLKRITEYLEILEKTDGQKVICCMKCGNQFCSAQDNYKKYALRSVRDPRELKSVADCDETLTYYREYICPGCGTLLQVEAWCPMLDSEEPFWDIDVKV